MWGRMVPRRRLRIHNKRFAGQETGRRTPSAPYYLEYMADLLLALEEMAMREGHRELAERLRHSRQAARRG
ncbi:protein of unknown function [Candidatus Filomicrobium marinum]|uniref:Uncharacterized protein n=2 Tax=Filomicrobium TaxID=119044 RepID=A0A0D6JA77_9HYPH|nr:protein of unknown function [Candidatus Filomicrobium marinum]CPR15426.1 protein of unknown function [Candidatus Filomicrobium marinum]SDO65365.1 hypothetical protein SAMN04488061_1311 [Filomicrobium insigne]